MSVHWPQLVTTFLCVLSGLNLLYIGWFVHTRRWVDTFRVQGDEAHTYHAHDFPENLPLFVAPSPVLMVAEESVHYPLLGHDSDAEWFALTAAGSGYLRLGHDDRLFMVSIFHQLHCLRVLNLAFSKARIATASHIQHCLNYLRQGALCSADLSLEPGNFEEKDFEVERAGATHTCRDWSVVYPIMEENLVRWLKENET